MLPFSLSQTDADSVNIERKTHSSSLIRDRMYVLHLLHLGYKRTECARIVGCHINSVTSYIRMYNEGGLQAIRQLSYCYPRHELHELEHEVDEALTATACNTVADAAQALATKFAYNRSYEAVRQFLHRLGYKHRKAGTFPGKMDKFEDWQAEQDAFIEKLNKLMDLAEDEVIDLVFSDAAHFVYGKFSRYLWSKLPRYNPSGHGRYRVNVYGIYNVVTNEVHTLNNEGYIDAIFVQKYLEWIRQHIYCNRKRPLHIVLDNARYQHCDLVKQTASRLNITLEFLPGYSPNLNLIERLWKYMKTLLARQYHNCKHSFHKAVTNLTQALNQEPHKTELWTRLHPRFQRFEKSQILPW